MKRRDQFKVTLSKITESGQANHRGQSYIQVSIPIKITGADPVGRILGVGTTVWSRGESRIPISLEGALDDGGYFITAPTLGSRKEGSILEHRPIGLAIDQYCKLQSLRGPPRQ